jgi:hypothetical protein
MSKISVGERDKKIDEIASRAAEALCAQLGHAPDIEQDPAHYLTTTIPYLTVRTLHRHEECLNSLKDDSKWIKWSAIITAALTVAIVFLTIVLAIYAGKLDDVMRHLSQVPIAK